MAKKKNRTIKKNIAKRRIITRNANKQQLDIKHNPQLLQNPLLHKLGNSTDQRSINNDMLKVMLSRNPIGAIQDPAIQKMQQEIARLHGNNDYKQQYMDYQRHAIDEQKARNQQLDQDRRQFDIRKKNDQINDKIDKEMKQLQHQIEDYQRVIDKDQKNEDLIQKRRELKELQNKSEANKKQIEDNHMFQELKQLSGDIDQLQVQLAEQQAIMKSPEFIKPSEVLIGKYIEKERLNQRLKIEQQAYEQQQQMNNMKAQLEATKKIKDENQITKEDRDRMIKSKQNQYMLELSMNKANEELKYRRQYKQDIQKIHRDNKHKLDDLHAIEKIIELSKPTDDDEAKMTEAINEKFKLDQEHNRLIEQRKEQDKQRQTLKDLQDSNKRRKLENEQQLKYNDSHKITDDDMNQYNEALKEKYNIEANAKQLQAESQAYNQFHNDILQMKAKTNMDKVQNEITKRIIQNRKSELDSKQNQDEFDKAYTAYVDTQMVANANKRQIDALDRRFEDIAKYQEDTERLHRENESKMKWIDAKEQDMQTDKYKAHLKTMAENRVAINNRQKQLNIAEDSIKIREKSNIMMAQLEAAKRFGDTDTIPDAEVYKSMADQIEDAVKEDVEKQLEFERVKHAYNIAKTDVLRNANYRFGDDTFTEWLNINFIKPFTPGDLMNTDNWDESDYKTAIDMLNFMNQPQYKNFANDKNTIDKLATDFNQYVITHHAPEANDDDDDFLAGS